MIFYSMVGFCQDTTSIIRDNYLSEISNYDALEDILNDLGVSAQDMKTRSNEVISKIGWSILSKSKKIEIINEGFELNTMWIDNNHINYIEGGFFSNATLTNKMEIKGIPVAVSNRIVHSYSPNSAQEFRLFTNVNVDLNKFRNNKIKNNFHKTDINDLYNSDKVTNEIKLFLLSENIEQILLDQDILKKEKEYISYTDSIGIYKDTLTGLRNALNDTISNSTESLKEKIRFLNTLAKLRIVYNDIYSFKNKYYTQLLEKIDGVQDFDLSDLKDEFESKSRDTLGDFILTKSSRLNNLSSILNMIETINFGFQTFYISDYTIAGVPLQGLQVSGHFENTKFMAFSGKVFGRKNDFLEFDPLLNNQSVIGNVHLVRLSKKHSNALKNDIIFQYQEGDPLKKEIEGGRALTISSITSAEFLEKFTLRSEISSQYKLDSDNSNYGEEIIENSAFNLNLSYKVFKELRLFSRVEYVGSNFRTIGNPFLINNRFLTEVGTEYDKKNFNLTLGWQTWNSLPTVQASSGTNQKRFILDSKYRLGPFQFTAKYRPVSIIHKRNSTASGNSQTVETNMYNIGIKYYTRNSKKNGMFIQTLNLTNLKTNLSLSDTILRTDLNYVVSNTIKRIGANSLVSLIVSLGIESGEGIQDINVDLAFNYSGKNSDFRYSLQYIRFPYQNPYLGGQIQITKDIQEQIGVSVMVQVLHPTGPDISINEFRKIGSLGIYYKIVQ